MVIGLREIAPGRECGILDGGGGGNRTPVRGCPRKRRSPVELSITPPKVGAATAIRG